MIRFTFYNEGRDPVGFEVSGHSGMADPGSDIVCAAVSSAVLLTANNATDFIGADASVRESDGYLRLVLNDGNEEVVRSLRGLEAHITSLAEQYPRAIRVIKRRI